MIIEILYEFYGKWKALLIYTKNEMCSELGIEREKFDVYWNQKERERYSGEISFADSILFVL